MRGRACTDVINECEMFAINFLGEHYSFESGDVLFKPTLASKNQFRFSMDDALSYFIGGKFSEDKGFALRPWVNIRFGERKIIILKIGIKKFGQEQILQLFSFGHLYFKKIIIFIF